MQVRIGLFLLAAVFFASHAKGQSIEICPGEDLMFSAFGLDVFSTEHYIDYSVDGENWVEMDADLTVVWDPYEWEEGFYRLRVPDVVCDTTYVSEIWEVLQFEIKDSLQTIESCDPLIFEGEIISESGLYDYGPFTDVNGCDSTFTIDFSLLEGCCPDTAYDVDGNLYTTIQIGDQCWMKENFRASSFYDGTPITQAVPNETWSSLTGPGYSWPHNNSNNEEPYGKIYNGYTIESENNLCPLGWHVATDDDWIEMELYLGMDPSETFADAWRGGDVNLGGKLKSTEYWWPNDATNESGFTALPGDVRIESGEFSFILGSYGCYWTSSESGIGFYSRYISYADNGVWRNFSNLQTGLSVRCIKD